MRLVKLRISRRYILWSPLLTPFWKRREVAQVHTRRSARWACTLEQRWNEPSTLGLDSETQQTFLRLQALGLVNVCVELSASLWLLRSFGSFTIDHLSPTTIESAPFSYGVNFLPNGVRSRRLSFSWKSRREALVHLLAPFYFQTEDWVAWTIPGRFVHWCIQVLGQTAE